VRGSEDSTDEMGYAERAEGIVEAFSIMHIGIIGVGNKLIRRYGMNEKVLLDEVFELALQNDMNYLG